MKTHLRDNYYCEGFDNFEDQLNYKLCNHQIIFEGRTSKISEKIAKGCCEKIFMDFDLYAYRDYVKGIVAHNNASIEIGFITAKQSIQSALTKPDGSIYEYLIIWEQ